MQGSGLCGESMAKLVTAALEMAPVRLVDVLRMCTACNRTFTKEHQRLCLSRACVQQLLQAVKFKSTLPEKNYIVLLNVSAILRGK